MRIKRHFTIVELLIAMGLMMIVSNILATMYARASRHAVNIVATQKLDSGAQTTLNRIANDFANARIDNTNNLSSRNFRLLSTHAPTYSTKSGSYAGKSLIMDWSPYNYKANKHLNAASGAYDPSGYPYVVFTATDSLATTADINSTAADSSDGYKEIAYWAVPSQVRFLERNNHNTPVTNGTVFDPYMSLIRFENTSKNPDDSVFNYNKIKFFQNQNKIIQDRVLWIDFSYGKFEESGVRMHSFNTVKETLGSATDAHDGEVLTFSEYQSVDSSSTFEFTDGTPDYVDVLLSVMPENKDNTIRVHKALSLNDYSYEIRDFFDDSGTPPGQVLIIKDDDPTNVEISFPEGENFSFPKQGHLYYNDPKGTSSNDDLGYVIRYVRHADPSDPTTQYLYLTVQAGYDRNISISLPGGQNYIELLAADSYFKRIPLK